MLVTNLSPLFCSAEKQTQASASSGRARGLHQVHRAHPDLRHRHRGGPPGLRGRLLPAPHLSVQNEGEALSTSGRPRPRSHRRLPGKETFFVDSTHHQLNREIKLVSGPSLIPNSLKRLNIPVVALQPVSLLYINLRLFLDCLMPAVKAVANQKCGQVQYMHDILSVIFLSLATIHEQ